MIYSIIRMVSLPGSHLVLIYSYQQLISLIYIFSNSTDGKIKVWLYDSIGSRVDFDAPGHGCAKLLYSADGTRLFSCSTSKEGESFLVEWNESAGEQQRTYLGFRTKSAGIVQFDTTQNRFLAAGEDHQIKFWDMDNINMLTSTDAGGGLPSLPKLKFNKNGNILLVSTADNGFKILANGEGLRTLKAFEGRAFEMLRSRNEAPGMEAPGPSAIVSASPAIIRGEPLEANSPVRPSPLHSAPLIRTIEKPRVLEDAHGEGNMRELAEIVDPSKCRVITLPGSGDPASKVGSLIYTHTGAGIVALGFDGIKKIWRWTCTDHNPSGLATTSVVPQHWISNTGLRMIHDVSDVKLEDTIPCITLSKNDSYILSACGGRLILFNLWTAKVMLEVWQSPPTATCLAFHPQDNNIVAIGMNDLAIYIYNIKYAEVKAKLEGHRKRITGLSFSVNRNILVSSGADAQLCSWDTGTWEKKKAITIQAPSVEMSTGETGVEFHSDRTRLLVFHATQLAIYDASKMECIQQWVPQEVLSAPIAYAAYSCNSQLIYAAFSDGNLGVFDAESLRLRCRIAPAAYLSQPVLNSQSVQIHVLATHPKEPNQLAIGLTDGTVKVLEPLESGGRWWEVGATTETGPSSQGAPTEAGANSQGEPTEAGAPTEAVACSQGEPAQAAAPTEAVASSQGEPTQAAAPTEAGASSQGEPTEAGPGSHAEAAET